ncbi:DUF3969 family protein [Chitinivorax sp. B]|uniref:DUF3969 family protein n=1 Tax=Chitinivorax sp. B TaxID=2502235 RepID=UPI0010F7DD9D|nr:DUF3969 family protein [Chitinivorax sp. B]
MYEEIYRLERIFYLLSIGLCHAIKNGAIDIDEAERYLYSPLMMRLLKEEGASDVLHDLIHAGTELEDTESLAPASLGKELDEMISRAMQTLKESPVPKPMFDKWFNPIFERNKH